MIFRVIASQVANKRVMADQSYCAIIWVCERTVHNALATSKDALINNTSWVSATPGQRG